MGTEFQFGMMENFWRSMMVMIVQHCECTNATELHTQNG